MAQDRPLELAQPWAGLDAELLAQLRVGPPVGIERVRLAPGSVEGEHQLAPGKLSVGMLGHERRKLRDELDVVTEGQPCLVAQLVGNQPKLAEPLPLDCDEPNERETRQGLSLPELECSVECAFRARRIARSQRRPAFGEALLEDERVDLARFRAQQIPGAAGGDPVSTEDAAQVVDVDLKCRLRAARRVVVPEAVDRRLARDHPVGAQEQDRQQEALLRSARLDGLALLMRFQRPEHAERRA